MRLFIGLMSGTSMDGVDAALVDLETNNFIKGIICPYSTETYTYLQQALSEPQSMAFYSQLNTRLGVEFANAVITLLATVPQYTAKDIIAIGSHGQTLCHDATAPIPYTVQLGCAHTIAELTGITVIADFRTRDLVVGGQGAPFAPIYHQALLQQLELPLAIVNIGGIANLTYLSLDNQVSGYDIGPGNCLMDAWVFAHLGHHYDQHGRWAAMGIIIDALLKQLLTDPFFHQPWPKSIGKEYFSLQWLTPYLTPDYQPCDVQATLLQLTAITIVESINAQSLCPTQLLLCGGGVHNRTLLQRLSQLLPGILVQSIAAVGANPDFVEALMFAWLAEKTLNHYPLDLNAITGAKKPAILGAIYPAGIDKRN